MKNRKNVVQKLFRRGDSKRLINSFDQYVNIDIIDATKRGKLLLGLDESKIFSHPSLVYSIPAVKSKININKDRVRFDVSHFNALYFGQDYLYYYNTHIDHAIKGSYNDIALELPYKQIKALETSIKFVKINKLPHYVFELTLKLEGLNDIKIPLKMMLFDPKTAVEDYLIDQNLLNIVSELKKFLRTKNN